MFIAAEDINAIEDHPKGGLWPFIVAFSDHIYAGDDRTELMGLVYDALVVDSVAYGDKTVDEAFEARYDVSLFAAQAVQTAALVAAAEADVFDPVEWAGDPVKDQQMQALFAPRTDVFEGTWDSDVPLTIVSAHYAPFTQVPLPEGENVICIDPRNDETMLNTLAAVGLIEFFEHEDLDAVYDQSDLDEPGE
jgi:hypothetical protein